MQYLKYFKTVNEALGEDIKHKVIYVNTTDKSQVFYNNKNETYGTVLEKTKDGKFLQLPRCIVCYYDVTTIEETTKIAHSLSNFVSMEVDGEEQTLSTSYLFDTLGEHKVIFQLKDITSIGNSAFYNCTNLSNVELPDSVTSISNSAFNGCSNITLSELPSGITSIGSNAFYGCSNITSLTIMATIPPTLGNTNALPSTITAIYVPSASVDDYKNATNWSYFANRIVGIIRRWENYG